MKQTVAIFILIFLSANSNISLAQNVSIQNVIHTDTVQYESFLQISYFVINTDYDCSLLEMNSSSSSLFQIDIQANVSDLELIPPLGYYWFSFSQNVEFEDSAAETSVALLNENTNDTIDICLYVEDAVDNNCYLCDTLVWNGEEWLKIASNLTEYVITDSINITMSIVPVGEPLNNYVEIPLETFYPAEEGFSVGDSVFFANDIEVNMQSFQQAGDNLVVIWPSSVSPIIADTSFTPIHVLDNTISIDQLTNDSKQIDSKIYDMMGKEYKSIQAVPNRTVFIYNQKKYIKYID
jgi:hypothetical protein